jgi:hypothetical protein
MLLDLSWESLASGHEIIFCKYMEMNSTKNVAPFESACDVVIAT